MKLRSKMAITHDGYILYTSNFKKLFLASWFLATIYAFAFSIFANQIVCKIIPALAIHVSNHSISYDISIYEWLYTTLYACLFATTAFLFASTAVWAFIEHRQNSSIPFPNKWYGKLPGKWYLLFWKKAVKWGLTTGFHHMGTILITLIFTFLITIILTFTCELPAIIIGIANVKAYTGLVMGDPFGMPEYVSWLTLSVFFFVGFFQAYAHLVTLFPFYYAYGTIECLRQERQKYKI